MVCICIWGRIDCSHRFCLALGRSSHIHGCSGLGLGDIFFHQLLDPLAIWGEPVTFPCPLRLDSHRTEDRSHTLRADLVSATFLDEGIRPVSDRLYCEVAGGPSTYLGVQIAVRLDFGKKIADG